MSRRRQENLAQTEGFSLHRYGRFWAVYDQSALLVVTVYRRGALEVIRRLTALHVRTQTDQHGGNDDPAPDDQERALADALLFESQAMPLDAERPPDLPRIITNNRPLRDITADIMEVLERTNDPPVLF